jgi:15-cis-phytoene synthase
MAETPDWHPRRYLASLYSLPSERPVLDTLFGIESEIVASLQGRLDHNVAHVRLQWWREECARVAKGTPAHPLTRALVAEFSDSRADALAGLSGFVDVAVWDLARATFETRRELTAYCERWASAMIVPAASHATAAAKDTSVWVTIGSAMHEAEMLAQLTSEAHSGRLRVPLDELESAGVVEPESLAVTPHAPALAVLLGERQAALRSILTDAIQRVEATDQPALRGLLVWVALTWRRSLQAQRALPGSPVPRRSDALGDAWCAWRAGRRATAGRFGLDLS